MGILNVQNIPPIQSQTGSCLRCSENSVLLVFANRIIQKVIRPPKYIKNGVEKATHVHSFACKLKKSFQKPIQSSQILKEEMQSIINN